MHHVRIHETDFTRLIVESIGLHSIAGELLEAAIDDSRGIGRLEEGLAAFYEKRCVNNG